MSNKKNLPKIDLMQAFAWICDNCGKKNFEAAIGMDVDPEKERNIKENISECSLWIDMLGGFYMAPEMVRCDKCKTEYEVNQDDEEDM